MTVTRQSEPESIHATTCFSDAKNKSDRAHNAVNFRFHRHVRTGTKTSVRGALQRTMFEWEVRKEKTFNV